MVLHLTIDSDLDPTALMTGPNVPHAVDHVTARDQNVRSLTPSHVRDPVRLRTPPHHPHAAIDMIAMIDPMTIILRHRGQTTNVVVLQLVESHKPVANQLTGRNLLIVTSHLHDTRPIPNRTPLIVVIQANIQILTSVPLNLPRLS